MRLWAIFPMPIGLEEWKKLPSVLVRIAPRPAHRERGGGEGRSWGEGCLLVARMCVPWSAWGPGYETAGGSLRLYMAQLRRKLEDDPARPRHLLNEPGLGYRFQP